MRLLELVFLAALVLAAFAVFIPPTRRRGWMRKAPHLALTLALVHAFIDEGRWSLFPAYGTAVLLAVAATWRLRSVDAEARDRPILRRIGGSLALVVSIASAGLAWAFPVFTLPEPTGRHRVGTRWIFLPDTSREEDLTPEPGDTRALAVRIWFPADSVVGDADRYSEREVARATAQGLRLPGFVLSHLANVTTHAHRRAWLPPTPAKLPLLLFSHGYGSGNESQNTVQMEELASHGYVVASIDHTYEAGAVIFPSGEVVTARLPFNPMLDTVALRETMAVVKKLGEARDTTEAWAAIQAMHASSKPLERSVARWTDDTRFVLDRLTAMMMPHVGPDTLLPGRVATDRVGIFGMSFGGATAAGFCLVDTRCVAGADLDGLIYGDASRTPFTRPFLFASSEETVNVHRIFYERASAPAWFLVAKGAKHMDWTDFNLIVPVMGVKIGMLGGIPARRMHPLMNDVLVSYFDAALRGKSFDVGVLRQRYPEASLEARDGTPAPPAVAASTDSGKATGSDR